MNSCDPAGVIALAVALMFVCVVCLVLAHQLDKWRAWARFLETRDDDSWARSTYDPTRGRGL